MAVAKLGTLCFMGMIIPLLLRSGDCFPGDSASHAEGFVSPLTGKFIADFIILTRNRDILVMFPCTSQINRHAKAAVLYVGNTLSKASLVMGI
jgi:hypothetical protein